MKCPECGAECWRNEIHNGVGIVHDEWKCIECDWTEDDGFPLSDKDWDNFNSEFENSLK